MEKQSEAERLADSLEADFNSDTFNFDDMIQSAAELRRLHAENGGLRKAKVALRVINGEICYKSNADDQSYGMWCPVTYDSEHCFPNGTEFYTR